MTCRRTALVPGWFFALAAPLATAQRRYKALSGVGERMAFDVALTDAVSR